MREEIFAQLRASKAAKSMKEEEKTRVGFRSGDDELENDDRYENKWH